MTQPADRPSCGSPTATADPVLVPPVADGVRASVGAHVQATDEIYYVHRGSGVLTTNGEARPVASGFLAIARRGTRHGIRIESGTEPLGFLVIELKVPDGAPAHQPAAVPSLIELLKDGSEGPHPAAARTASGSLRMTYVELGQRLSAPWGALALLEVPAGGCIDEYRDDAHDENIFVVSGTATIVVGSQRFVSEDRGLNVLVPRGLRRGIRNGSVATPLVILSVLVRSQGARVAS